MCDKQILIQKLVDDSLGSKCMLFVDNAVNNAANR